MPTFEEILKQQTDKDFVKRLLEYAKKGFNPNIKHKPDIHKGIDF